MAKTGGQRYDDPQTGRNGRLFLEQNRPTQRRLRSQFTFMQAQNAKANWIEQHPLLFALSISLALHVVLFLFGGTLLSMAILKNPDLLKQIAQSPERIIELTAQELRPTPPQREQAKQEAERQMPMLFIEVDPSKAVKEAPENTKFYAAQSTLASNPDTKLDTDLPKIDGKQTQITRAFDAPRSQPKPMPLQPSPPPQAKVEAQPKKEIADQPREQAKQKASEQKQNSAEQVKQAPGDLDRKIPPQTPAQTAAAAETPAAPPARPKTLTEARLRQSDSRPPGEKMKQEGGARNISSDFSFSAKGTPLGDYDARIVDAIRTKWYALLDGKSSPRGHVTIEFRLYSNGAVRNVKTTEKDVDELFAYLCQSAIITPAPYEKWPDAVRTAVGMDYRDVKFTFFYN